MTGRRGFLLGFLLVALLVAGGLSSFASSSPDGLDTVTLHGCTVTETAGGEQLDGTCIARNAGEHATAGSPLADYAVFGGEGTVGLAGVVGVLVTLVLAGGLFRVLRRRSPAGSAPSRDD
ncbi:PDGLE domain-containing protein [Pseudonocardia yuanmonensis]|uniref:PDGLE domain-containing protein n=1 Tax=Pseudonocardia yuanmonensis TaxID=1095914 RepID=A0ABP8W3B7_9PSEU